MKIGYRRELIRIAAVLGLILVLTPASSFAEEPDMPPSEQPHGGLVELHTGSEYVQAYRERRTWSGILIGVSTQTYNPKNYVSVLDGVAYEDAFAAMPDFSQIEGGWKLNLAGVSVAFLLNYGRADRSSAKSGENRAITIERTMLRTQLIIDGLLPEPYVAPYGSFDFWDGGTMTFGVDESIPALNQKFSGKTGSGSALTAGVLLQLNWLEKNWADSAYRSVGIENTYLDLFAQKVNTTSGSDDPDVSSDFSWGAGVKIEF